MNTLFLMKTYEVAEFYHVSKRTVEGWRHRKTGPEYIRMPNGKIRYEREEVLRFLGLYRPKSQLEDK